MVSHVVGEAEPDRGDRLGERWACVGEPIGGDADPGSTDRGVDPDEQMVLVGHGALKLFAVAGDLYLDDMVDRVRTDRATVAGQTAQDQLRRRGFVGVAVCRGDPELAETTDRSSEVCRWLLLKEFVEPVDAGVFEGT